MLEFFWLTCSCSSWRASSSTSASGVAMSLQDDLRDVWWRAPEGKLCGREQAKAWALREVWRAEDKSDYGMLTFIAGKLNKTSGGMPGGGPPNRASMKEFFDKIDADPDWHPGKASETRRGPKRLLRGAKLAAIVSNTFHFLEKYCSHECYA